MVTRHKRGFTLVELLVVIAIIAVLAAILFPVFAAVRRNARVAADSSNLHELGMALASYLQDHRGHAPPTLDVLANDGSQYIAPGDLLHKTNPASRPFSYQDDGYGNVLYNYYGYGPDGYAVDASVYFDPMVNGTGDPPEGWAAWQAYGINNSGDFPMMRNPSRPKFTVVTWSPYNRSKEDATDPPYDVGLILVLRADGTVGRYADEPAKGWFVPDANGLSPFSHQTQR